MQTKDAKELASGTNRKVIAVSPDAAVKQALQLMKDADIHHLVVLKDGKCMGIVRAKDIIGEVEAGKWFGGSRTVTVGEVMRPNVPMLDEKTDIKTALSYMLENGVTALPLVREGKVTGVITETDLLRLMQRLIEGNSSAAGIRSRAEAVVANPLVQNLMKALGDAGI